MAGEPFTPQRITGSLVRAGTYTVPADPGWSQPDRHRADSAGGATVRDDASMGGGWAPASWGAMPTVLGGATYHNRKEATGHRRFADHHGPDGAGGAAPDAELDSTDRNELGDAPGPLYGAGGAAHGGISPQGVSQPWAYPALTRRRADGGVVIRDGALDLGKRHIHTTMDHRQGLHMNRPTIRYVRDNQPVHERSSPYPGSAQGAPRTSPYNPIVRPRTFGVVTPRARRILRPFGQTDMTEVDQHPSQTPAYDPGTIGGEWAL